MTPAAAMGSRGALPRSWRAGREQAPPPAIDPPLSMRVAGEAGVVLAERLRGEPALPWAGRQVVISPARLTHHALVMGATGSGKTETLLRLAWVLAKRFDAQVLYLDGQRRPRVRREVQRADGRRRPRDARVPEPAV